MAANTPVPMHVPISAVIIALAFRPPWACFWAVSGEQGRELESDRSAAAGNLRRGLGIDANLLGENAKMALDTLRENKLRSFLTVLGVVIGITALITVSSILVGFYADVTAVSE
jgi:hypothetical protein